MCLSKTEVDARNFPDTFYKSKNASPLLYLTSLLWRTVASRWLQQAYSELHPHVHPARLSLPVSNVTCFVTKLRCL